MELKATAIGQHLAQHPYNRVRLLAAGVEVLGDNHRYLIPFNQLLEIECKRGLVWGELAFLLPHNEVVRLHGTQWKATQRFYRYLNDRWQQWSLAMSNVAAGVLDSLLTEISQITNGDKWLTHHALELIQQRIRELSGALPLPQERLVEFDNCQDAWLSCLAWSERGEVSREAFNDALTQRMRERYADFFEHIEDAPLNVSQARAVVNSEPSLLVLAGAGSGKTSVLVARAGWLLTRDEASSEQILLLAFDNAAAQDLDERIRQRLHTEDIRSLTFQGLALHIIQQSGRPVPRVSLLENDTDARHQFLIAHWREQCGYKKVQAKGWRQWLEDELKWEVPEGDYWQDERLAQRLVGRLDNWLMLMRMHAGSQADMVTCCPEEVRDAFRKRVKLMAPLLKEWKIALKAEQAVDVIGLIHQATDMVDKGHFVSPWKHILVDEFQDISPQNSTLLSALRRQNRHTMLYALGDDWQAIYRFRGATPPFQHYFDEGDGDSCVLDTTYRFNHRTGEITRQFIQQNPHQRVKPLNSAVCGDNDSITLLADDKLEALLDKLSGYVTPTQRVLILARYYHLRPALLNKATTRWPGLKLEFMTIHASKGLQADYVIVLGLQRGHDSFPAPVRESVMEYALLAAPEDFPDAHERRLLYVAMTRARHRVWLLFNKQQPSSFVEELKQRGVTVMQKP